jgi:hypothetical protein
MTLEILATGVPMVCIPTGRDRDDTAARVVHHGAGVRLSRATSASMIQHRGHEGARADRVPVAAQSSRQQP